MSIREGSAVAYVGHESGGVMIGDEGRLIAVSGSAGHVRWTSGSSTGELTLVPMDDLTTPLDPSRVPPVQGHINVRDLYDESGEAGLINAMSDQGYLSGLAQISEDILSEVQGRISQDPDVHATLAPLDPAERGVVLETIAMALFRDAFDTELE